MGLFSFSTKLQFRACSHGDSCTSPPTAREGECFYKGEKEVGRAIVNKGSWLFTWLFTARRKEETFLYLLGSATIIGREGSPSWSPNFTLFICLFVYLFILLFFRATLVAYGGSQTRGLIRATTASLHHSHSHAGSQRHL